MADHKGKSTQIKKSIGCSFFLFAIPLSFVFALILVFAGLLTFFVYDYSTWSKNFENSHLASDFYTITPENTKSVEGKIKTFNEDRSSVSTVTFTKEEVFTIVATSFQANVPANIRVEKGYVEAGENHWKVYLKTSYDSKTTVWMIYDLEKDKGENIDIFFYDISLGNYSFTQYGLGNIVDQANDGLRDSLKLIENSDFTGKRIKNIIMESNSISIKGEK